MKQWLQDADTAESNRMEIERIDEIPDQGKGPSQQAAEINKNLDKKTTTVFQVRKPSNPNKLSFA